MTTSLIAVALLFSAPEADSPSAVWAAPVGFVVHRTAPDHEALSGYPATAELSDVFHWDLRERPERALRLEDIAFDGAKFEPWYANVAASRRLAYPIIDTSIHHTSYPWRQALTREAGENLVGFDGRVWDYSSLHSPLFRESVRRYAQAVVGWVEAHDAGRRIGGYLGGAEWFYPGSLDYSPAALQAFSRWLKGKYGDLAALNAAWGADLTEWSQADPPRHWMVGDPQVGMRTFGINGAIDMGWFSPQVSVAAGVWYDASVGSAIDGIPEGLCVMSFVWFGSDGGVLRTDSYAPNSGTGVAQARVRAPEGAVRVALLFKAMAPGSVRFSAPRLHEAADGADLLPAPAPTADGIEGWHFGEWFGEGDASIELRDGRVVMQIDVLPQTMPYHHTGVALEDFVVFSFEAMADWLNESAACIKSLDPSRPVISYVGYVFGQPVLWDYASVEQRLDISLANTPELDVNGFQICIANEDFTYATANIDLARKYGKPMWCTDLVDFPYGHYSGFEAIYRGSLACAQHGMTGFFWYCWTGVPDYSFSQHLTTDELNRLLRDVRSASAAVEGKRLVTSVAQLMPVMTYSLADPGGRKGDALDNAGLHHLLQDCGITPDVYTPYEIEKRGPSALDRYDAVFLSDCPVLPKPAHTALVEYLRNGGVLLASGSLPQHDLSGEPLPPLAEDPARVIALGDRVGRGYWGNVRLEAVHGNTPAVYVEVDDPGRTPFARAQARRRVADALDAAGVTLPLRMDPACEDAHAALFRDDATDEYTLFALNRQEGRAHRVTVDLNLPEPAATVSAIADFEKPGTPSLEARRLTLPDFSHACIVTISTSPQDPQ